MKYDNIPNGVLRAANMHRFFSPKFYQFYIGIHNINKIFGEFSFPHSLFVPLWHGWNEKEKNYHNICHQWNECLLIVWSKPIRCINFEYFAPTALGFIQICNWLGVSYKTYNVIIQYCLAFLLAEFNLHNLIKHLASKNMKYLEFMRIFRIYSRRMVI